MSAPALLLEDVLHRPDIWRGNGLAALEQEPVASGFSELDAELPGSGWPRGVLIELMAQERGIGELSLLLPALRKGADEGPIAVVAPPALAGLAHAPAWAAQFPLSRLVIVEAPPEDIAWSVELLLTSAALGGLLAWLPERMHNKSLRRLQMAAQGRRTLAFMFRSVECAAQASPAPLRLNLTGRSDGLQVRILKRRGAPTDKALILKVERPVAWQRVQGRAQRRQLPAPVLAAAR